MMPDLQTLVFESYRLDLSREQLWRGQDVIPLTNKAFAVLRYLVENAEQLVTRDALMEAVWPDTFVSDAALTVCIHELRQAFNETAQAPQFIETVRGRGYRFLAPVLVSTPTSTEHPARVASQSQTLLPTPRSVELVGRETELRQLQQNFVTALQGERQVVFITGESGIGKTALVEAFMSQMPADKPIWIGYGQCIDQYGAGEAYLPLLEALGRLCRGAEGQMLVDLLRHEAPSWLVQMPAFLSPDEFEVLQRRGGGATQERMLRELAEAIEQLTASHPLILVLEDLHWSDRATLDWLIYVARRRGHAQLLVMGTYRPVEAIVKAHPLRTATQELKRHGQCGELLLDYLSIESVASYVKQRFGPSVFPEAFSQVIHQYTNGNPLFMVALLDYLVQRGVLEKGAQDWVLRDPIERVPMKAPESLWQLIEDKLEGLSPKALEILEAGSVMGLAFSTAAVADAVDATEDEVEQSCATLSRRQQFLQAQGLTEGSDGTVSARYGFIHAFYQEVLYHRVPAGRRARLHRRIGARLEVGHGEHSRDIAAELAMHFIQGREFPKAVHYLQHAGENALHRSAHREAIAHFNQGLDLLLKLPETLERGHQELRFLSLLGPALVVTKGYGAPEVEATYVQARRRCQDVGEAEQLFSILFGLWRLYIARTTYPKARELGEELLALAEGQQDAMLLSEAHYALGHTLCFQGHLVLAQSHLEQGISLFAPQPERQIVFLHQNNAKLSCLFYLSLTLCLRGWPDQALQRIRDVLDLAQALASDFSLTAGYSAAAFMHQLRGERQASYECAEAALRLARDHDYPHWIAMGTILSGWAKGQPGPSHEGLAEMTQGLGAMQALGSGVAAPHYLALLADAYRKAGQIEQGLARLSEAVALVHQTGERCWEAELHRLRGTFLLEWTNSDTLQAEASFHQAIEIAREQQAKSWELRAATSLARLWQSQGKRQEARELLAPVYEWFTEGFDTSDLIEAKAVLGAGEYLGHG